MMEMNSKFGMETQELIDKVRELAGLSLGVYEDDFIVQKLLQNFIDLHAED